MSARLVPGRRADDFLWATGIEDTFVPQTRPGHRALDEYQLMSHYQHWREDLALVGDLGLRAVRWGVPWYRVEPFQPGEFDWRWTDQVLPYLVGGCPYPMTELQNWYTEEVPTAGVVFDTPQGEVVVERHKKLKVTVGDETRYGEDAKAALDRLFGLDEKLRAALTYRAQGSTGFFLNVPDKEVKALLSRVLNLEPYEQLSAAAQEAGVHERVEHALATRVAQSVEAARLFAGQPEPRHVGVSPKDRVER